MADLQPISNEQLAAADAAAGAAPGGAYISDRFRVDNAPAEPAANYTFAGICAIVAFILFIAVLAILFQDWDFLKVA